MEFLDLARTRRSVRDYLDKAVEEEKMQLILEAGRMAPTAVNEQPQRIYVLKSPEAMEKIRNVTPMVYNAPVVLLICYDKRISWKADRFGDVFDAGEMDACIVTDHMMLQATELGLGTLWIRGYKTRDVVAAFGLPEHIVPVCMLAIGYANTEKPIKRTTRKPLSETMAEL